jgi:Fe-S cluster assembly protein SufD
MRRLEGLVVPLSELEVADDARLSFASLQLLPAGWQQLGVQAGRIGRDGSLRSFCASLGAAAGRVRADALLAGQGGEAMLVAGYFGTGDQLHDLRTVQDHVAPRTSSQLLCMGAVTDHARSAYVGLTRVRNGAHGADAFQTNRNLVLSDGAHADSVPNLDIEENEVRCSHASTVGPIDEDQRYYLESRGIAPAVAERLIVLGFFNDLSGRVPVASVGKWFMSAVSDRIREHVGRDAPEDEDEGTDDSGESRG